MSLMVLFPEKGVWGNFPPRKGVWGPPPPPPPQKRGYGGGPPTIRTKLFANLWSNFPNLSMR